MATEANNPETTPALDPGQGQDQDAGKVQVETGGDEQGTPQEPSASTVSSIPEKFRGKSQEEIIQMYQEAERKIGQQGQEVGELRKALLGEPQSTEPPVDYSQQDQQDPLAVLKPLVDKLVEEKTRPYQVDAEILNVRSNNPDFEDHKAEILKIYAEHPQLRQPGNLNLVLEMARGRKVGQLAQKAKLEGKKEALETEEKKSRAFQEGGGKAKAGTPQITPEMLSKMSAAELKELL